MKSQHFNKFRLGWKKFLSEEIAADVSIEDH